MPPVCRPLACLAAAFAMLLAAAAPPRAAGLAQGGAALRLAFDRSLRDDSGSGNDAHAEGAAFEPGQRGHALRLHGSEAVVSDAANLRLAPGITLDLWVRFASVHGGIQPILVKDREYMLRVNPSGEGGRIAFFVFGGGWEPRVESQVVAEPGRWYHIVAGWDGEKITLEVDGSRAVRDRAGRPRPSSAPVVIGPLDGMVDEVTIVNPGAARAGVAHWSFEGDLRDVTGAGHDLSPAEALFVAGRSGQALKVSQAYRCASAPDLQLAAGIRVDCSVRFDALSPDTMHILLKEGEYQLRVDPQSEGGRFSFFVNAGGWEPRVQSPVKAEPGVWYRVVATWNGVAMTLEVNGERKTTVRSGLPRPGDAPLVVGPLPGALDELWIENPRLPALRMKSMTSERTLLAAGRPERLMAVIENVGTAARGVTATLATGPGARSDGPAEVTVGDLGAGETRQVAWTVSAPVSVTTWAAVRLTAQSLEPVDAGHILPFFASTDAAPELKPSVPGDGTTWHIDGLAGDNGRSGTSPQTAWRDFTRLNGKTLGPGDRVLIRRGSVINQELQLSARGTAARWAEIGTYGKGPRPIIRRDWDIADRCVWVRDPDYLRIRGLVVCFAGKGLVVSYTQGGRRGLVIEDCIAHHIEGIYRPNAAGIPEWRDRPGAPGDGLTASAGIAVVGAPASDVAIRDCEMYQCSWGFFVSGDAVNIDRVFCHDNTVHNTSPHPAMVTVSRSFLQNSVFDASGWHASAGTMGIMLVNPLGLVIRNCTFRNQPDSGSHDEGGIDFEAEGNGCLIDRCTFERNAGAAIEVLGLQSPQVRGLEITGSRFIQNNLARKLGPAEIYIWGQSPNPEVACSTGVIHGNGYVTAPGVRFVVNEAPKTTDWTVRGNASYSSPAALRRAMPLNDPPRVSAGPDVWSASQSVRLRGSVTDANGPAKARWEVVEGPGTVAFRSSSAPATAATFRAPGDYLLRLVGDDGDLWVSDTVSVHVLPAGSATLAAWDFNRQRDKQGWTEVSPGTRTTDWDDKNWPTRSEPVKYAAGGFYVVAIDGSPNASLLSKDRLGLSLSGADTVRLRLQNHTNARRLRLRYTTKADPAWDARKSIDVAVTPDDDAPRTYTVRLPAAVRSAGTLRQLRIDIGGGEEVTGTIRTDYIWVGRLGPARSR